MLKNTENRQLVALYDGLINAAALRVLINEPLDDILQMICGQMVDIFNLRLVWIGLKEPEGAVSVRAAAGPAIAYMHGLKVRWDDTPEGYGPSGNAIRSGQMQFNSCDAKGFWPWQRRAAAYGILSTAAFPLLVGREVVGILNVYNGKTDFFDEQALARLDQFTRKMAIAVQASIDRQRLQFLSFHDALTGLYNRAFFEEELSRIDTSRMASVGVIICDVDGLKLINDTLGHEAGDRLIIAAADILKKCFRKGDLVARIGGDEFAIVLPNVSRQVIEAACDKIYQAVAITGNSPVTMGLPFSLSVGCSAGTSADTIGSVKELLQQADASMYQEKLRRSPATHSAILAAAVKQLETRDFISDGHAERVEQLAVSLAAKAGLPEGRLAGLKLLAHYHDIGKIAIPESILFKPEPLTVDELKKIKKHSEIGHRITMASPQLASISDLVLKHHEWWNGEGYPLGIGGESIPLECRILSIADAYDAMTAGRPYRPRYTALEAMAELKRYAGRQFDPHLLAFFEATVL